MCAETLQVIIIIINTDGLDRYVYCFLAMLTHFSLHACVV